MNLNKLLMVLIFTLVVISQAVAKKAPTRKYAQIIPELMVSVLNKDTLSQQAISGADYNVNFKSAQSDSVESTALAYIHDFISKQPLNKQQNIQFEQISMRKGKATTTVRFKQIHNGLDVYGGEFSVSVNNSGAVSFATHHVVFVGAVDPAKQQLNEEQAFDIASAYFGHQVKKSDYSTAIPVLYSLHGQTQLVYQVDYKFFNQMGYWEFLIDAQTGEVIRAADQLHYDSVQATVFDPDPLSSSGQTYGGGYVDGNDQNTTQLSQELKTVSIDVLNQNGSYSLTGEWAESVDVSAPNDGDFSQASNDFRYNRGEDSFEAVNVFYHISTYLGFLNNDLGLNVRPYQYSTGIRFDAHGDNGDDNSFYSSEGLLVFGEGCVDDAEDADVVIHELGHGIHDWVTQGSLSQVDGLSEGTGDYFAQSYSRSRSGFAWTPNDAEYNYMFSWDGHNVCWPGRTTNYNRTYPGGLVQQIHTDGQIWSTCLMKVWDQLGPDKTDSMVVEGLSMTNSSTNQAQAAQAVLQAAGELGYSSDLSFIADTFNGCGYNVELASQVTVNISIQPSQPVTGGSTVFTANVSDGQAPYTYAWDINGDGVTDGTGQSIEATYAEAYSGAIKVNVLDAASTSGTASSNVSILGANLQLQQVVNIRENLDQICGNNDFIVDPGERWSTLLEVKNEGNRTATNAYLALSKSRQSATVGNTDTYGNTVSSCNRSFVDITGSGAIQTWEAASSNFPADDDGSALIQLAQSFDHYGQNVSQLRVSSNGYFSTSTDSNGGDWSNDCPLPAAANPDGVGGRIAPFHDDLKDSVLYHQSFTSCPRQAESGTDLACEVFLWKGADLYDTDGITEAIDVQAILYPATSQWVYQYGGSDLDSSGATIAIQNAQATDSLTYACNNASGVSGTEAVCIYNKNHRPEANGADFVMLESPTISLGDVGVNETQNQTLSFAVAEDATCGAEIGMDYQAAVYDEGFNAGENNIFTKLIGDNGTCNVVTSCGVGTTDTADNHDIQPRPGLWWNPVRNGNGLDMYTLNQDSLVYLYYTGDTAGEPIWYLANDADSSFNQFYNNITQYQAPGGFGIGALSFDTVGWSNTSFIDDSNAVQVRMIDGNLSAEKLIFFQYGADATPNVHTGLYYTPSESGWGESVGTLGESRVVINYIYDNSGNPYWTIASGPNDNSALDAYYFNTFCPSCPAVAPAGAIVGSVRLTLSGQTNGTLNQFDVTDDNVNWTRSNLPVVNIIPPGN
ncbi:MAG: PepSY domain-containing protein [Marinicella sp.]